MRGEAASPNQALEATADGALDLPLSRCLFGRLAGGASVLRSAKADAMRYLPANIALIAALLVSSFACALGDELPLVSGDTYRGVIIPIEMIQSDGHLTSRFDGFWLPSTNDIAQAETEIAKYIATAESDTTINTYTRRQSTTIFKKLRDYRRQYVGVLVRKEKRIFCNVLTADVTKHADWRYRYVHLTEGAPDCWKIQYLPGTHRCFNFDASFGY